MAQGGAAARAEETTLMMDEGAVGGLGAREATEGGGGGGGGARSAGAGEMRAVLLAGFGGLSKLRVARRVMPEPQDGELKIRIKACGLNFIDLMVRQGNIDSPPKTPLVPGFECSGIVEALGIGVKGFEIGDRVMAFVNYNAWAEVVCTPADFVYRIPDDMSFSEAAAFPMNFVTAYMMLFEVANLRSGMSVLVHSAGGGVGQAVAQLCSTVPNVTVFGTASSFKHEAIKDSVTHLFDRNVDYVQEVKRISVEGVDIVLDCLCGENTGKGLSLLKPLGTYILYGSSNMVTGETKSFFSFAKSWWQVEKVNPIKLYEENKVIAGFSLLNLLFKQGRSGLVKDAMDKLITLYNEKKIKPMVDSLWALEEVKEAMQRIHDRGNIGKLILDVEKAPTPLMANDSTETSEAGEEEEDHEGDGENKERMPFIQ
ncbi:synaptic vesicle membrane protein VAT-1 homolog-like [Tachyglossus aculeatus]|uniref:synaptic vesicle membrane protein VAT-1 homolog-like n=1 Tax=Tachyglossus aculeatus TaxID=9261 RepID=UPI0018F3F023|nr:synaptic vesicle membrane protein VAT-1 homolog-like [Tachyglossus aculeatus]